jgi:uncharacterized protein YkwD
MASPATAAPPVPRPTQTITLAADFGKRALARLNDDRRRSGARALRLSAGLARAALAHARAMATEGFFGHTSRDGASAAVRIDRYYRASTVGEVILWREPTSSPEQAVATWLSSPGHRSVLRSRAFRRVGIAAVHVRSGAGVYGGREVTIVVADFAAP